MHKSTLKKKRALIKKLTIALKNVCVACFLSKHKEGVYDLIMGVGVPHRLDFCVKFPCVLLFRLHVIQYSRKGGWNSIA